MNILGDFFKKVLKRLLFNFRMYGGYPTPGSRGGHPSAISGVPPPPSISGYGRYDQSGSQYPPSGNPYQSSGGVQYPSAGASAYPGYQQPSAYDYQGI